MNTHNEPGGSMKSLAIILATLLLGSFANAQMSSRILTHRDFVTGAATPVTIYESSGQQRPAFFVVRDSSSTLSDLADLLNSPLGRQYRIVSLDIPEGMSPAKAIAFVGTDLLYAWTAVYVGIGSGGNELLQARKRLAFPRGFAFVDTTPVGDEAQILTSIKVPVALITSENNEVINSLAGQIPVLYQSRVINLRTETVAELTAVMKGFLYCARFCPRSL